MGYTNYWDIKKADNKVTIPQAMIDEFNKIVDAKPRIYYKPGEYGGTPMVTLDQNKEGSKPILIDDQEGHAPHIDADCILFNGKEPEDYETFDLEPNGFIYPWNKGKPEYTGFCKTAYKPYDIFVKACLILAKKYGIITGWSFDGEKKDDDLYKATASLFKMLNIRMTLPKDK